MDYRGKLDFLKMHYGSLFLWVVKSRRDRMDKGMPKKMPTIQEVIEELYKEAMETR